MNKIWSLAVAALLVAACNNSNNSNEADTVAGTATTEAPAEETTTGVTGLQQSFSDLFAYMQTQDSTFAPQQFAQGAQSKMETLPPQPLAGGQLKGFEPFLIYNEDSTQAIDLYSYNYIITRRNGQVRMEEADPDTEVALVDVAANTRKRIFFAGPSITVIEAKWNGPDEIVMAGAEQLADNSIRPLIWQYNLKDSLMQTFSHDEAVAADVRRYKEEKTAGLRKL